MLTKDGVIQKYSETTESTASTIKITLILWHFITI